MPSRKTDGLDLPDINVLVALLHPDHVHHHLAQNWLSETPNFLTTPITEAGFLRLAMNPKVAGGSVTAGAALASLTSVRHHKRCAGLLADGTTLADPAIDLSGMAGYRLVTDLHLVNLAVRHNAKLVTFDRRLPEALVASDGKNVKLLG